MRIAGDTLLNIASTLARFEHVTADLKGPLEERHAPIYLDQIEEFEADCRRIGFEMSAEYAAIWLRRFKSSSLRTYESVRECAKGLGERLDEESGVNVFVVVEPRKRFLYEARALFGEAVDVGYPSTIRDIAEAGRCLALDRFPATVFHLMRVAEVALKVIARSFPNFQTKNRGWEQIIDEVLERIEAMPSGAERKLELREAVFHLREIKDLWRNPGIHADADFSPERTESIYNSVRSFMQRLVENGVVEASEKDSA